MKSKAVTLTLLLSAGLIAAAGLAQDAPRRQGARAVLHAKAPEMRLHRELESARVKLAASVASHTVSVEIDYERPDPEDSVLFAGLRRDDPFDRYDIGPFSGLVVGPNHILISDRCLGEFSEVGAGKPVEAITVTLPNGERWPARVVGREQQIDLALLELDCEIDKTCQELKVFPLPGVRVPVQRGESVIVVGRGQNPLGTLVNDGIVSAIRRETDRAFQIDARVGNSTLGAPVVNSRGALVGMVTLHNHQTFGQASGVSYAAYLDEVHWAYLQMQQGKFVQRLPAPFMGVAAEKKWPDKPGLEIGNVIGESGAQRAGLQVGDVILQVNGEDMNETEDLIAIISKHKVGETLTVKILRGELESDVKVTLGPRP